MKNYPMLVARSGSWSHDGGLVQEWGYSSQKLGSLLRCRKKEVGSSWTLSTVAYKTILLQVGSQMRRSWSNLGPVDFRDRLASSALGSKSFHTIHLH